MDRWELSVGDSIINKVQTAIQESGTLLVVPSKASFESEWCKKELSAGLMRKLDEKRVVVLPILIEDCNMPLFLKEKMYADFRTNFDQGLQSVLDAIAKVTNPYQGRLEVSEGNTDWAEDWGFNKDSFYLHFTIVQSPTALPMTFLTEISVFCNKVATSRYRQFEEAGVDWIGRAAIAEVLFDLGEREGCRVILDDHFPKEFSAKLQDSTTGAEYQVVIKSRKMGQDNGKAQVINVSDHLKKIREYVRSISRKPTPEELQKIREISPSPWNA